MIYLASTSQSRQKVLAESGIPAEIAPATAIASDRHEEDFKNTVKHLHPKQMAEAISAYKGLYTSERMPEAYILSGDQVGACEDGTIFSKTKTVEMAENQINQLSGKILYFYTSVTLCKGGEVIWQHSETPYIQHKKHTTEDVRIFMQNLETKEKPSVVGAPGGILFHTPHQERIISTRTGSREAFLGLPITPIQQAIKALKAPA